MKLATYVYGGRESYGVVTERGIQDIPAAWRERQQVRWQQLLEPVTVTWEGEALLVKIQLDKFRGRFIVSSILLVPIMVVYFGF